MALGFFKFFGPARGSTDSFRVRQVRSRFDGQKLEPFVAPNNVEPLVSGHGRTLSRFGRPLSGLGQTLNVRNSTKSAPGRQRPKLAFFDIIAPLKIAFFRPWDFFEFLAPAMGSTGLFRVRQVRLGSGSGSGTPR